LVKDYGDEKYKDFELLQLENNFFNKSMKQDKKELKEVLATHITYSKFHRYFRKLSK